MKELTLDYKRTAESSELAIYIINTGRIYNGMTTGIIKKLAKKYEKGTFETEKALKAFYNLATEGAKMYAREFSNANDWKFIFSVSDRKLTACELLEYYFENINGSNPIN